MERQEERRVPGASLSVVTRHWLGLEVCSLPGDLCRTTLACRRSELSTAHLPTSRFRRQKRRKMKILFYFLALHINNSLSTKLLKRELKDYDLAVCNDGSTAAYFYDQVRTISSSLYVYKLSFVTIFTTLYYLYRHQMVRNKAF